MKTVGILLATYNGEAYLDAQLASLARQTHKDFIVFIRDDDSTDGTLEILKNWSRRDTRFQIVTKRASFSEKKGPINAFFELIEIATQNPYLDNFFLCDQDDVWHSKKVESQLSELQKLGSNQCAGVFSDLCVMNNKSVQLAPSLHNYLQVSPSEDLWPSIIVQNLVTGCTLGFNRFAAELFLKSKSSALKYAIMHDHWMAIIIAANGKFAYLRTPLVAYRQHSQNASGGIKSARISQKIIALINSGLKERVFHIWQQSLALENCQLLKDLSLKSCLNKSALEMCNCLSQKGLKAQGPIRTFLFWIGSIIWKQRISQLNPQ